AGMVREFAGFDVRFTNVTLVAVAVLAAVAIVWRVRRPLTVGGVVLLAEVALVVCVLWFVEGTDRFGLLDARGRYSTVFTFALAAAVCGAFVLLWRTEPQPGTRWLFLATATGLMVVVAFGPGYGPQYAYWFLAALVASYVLLDDAWRRLLRVAWLVAALTYVVEYATVDYLGAGATRVFGSGG